MKHQITIEDTGEVYRCAEDESVLKGMARMAKKGIPVGCCGGGCGICKVEITQGDYQCKVMSRAHITVEEEEQSKALACRVFPRSDLTIRVVGLMKKNVCKCNDDPRH